MPGNSPDSSPSCAAVPLVAGTRRCAPKSSAIPGRWQSWSLRRDLDNPPLAALAANLPVFYHRLLSTKHPGTACPKHARAEVSLRLQVLENEGGFACHGG